MADAKKINALHAKGLTPPEIAERLMCGLQVVTAALTWTDQRVAEMARRAAEGQSAQAIADALGLTKNQVVGKGRRMGLTFKGKAPPPPRKARRPAKPKAPPREGVPLDDLPARGCRFAVNDSASAGGHLFCGAPAAEGKPYCVAHAALAYQSPEQSDKHRRGGEAALDALALARGDRAVGRARRAA